MRVTPTEAPRPGHNPMHDQISEWITHMKKAAAFLNGEARPSEIEALAMFYEREVRPHFAYEERKLFPALRRLEPSPSLSTRLAEFEHEHVVLLEKLEPLIADLRELAAGRLGGPKLVDLSRRARLAIDLLLLHAAREDDLMLPLMERHQRALTRELAEPTAL